MKHKINKHGVLEVVHNPHNKPVKKCPNCGGGLYPVQGETEAMLWCDTCEASIDSDGGMIA